MSGQIDSLAGLGKAMRERGHEVRLLAPFQADDLLAQPLTAIDTGSKSLAAASADMLKAVPRILQASADADLLHLALPTPAFAWVADVVQAASKRPMTVTFEGHLAHGRAVVQRALRRPASLKSRLPLWLVNNGLFARMSMHLCQRYIVSSEYQRQELVALGVPYDRVAVITNIVESSKLRWDARDARAELGLPRQRPVIGYIGHFNDVKGVDVLAEAFASLVKRGHNFGLALAWSGQGDATAVRRRLASVNDHVTWLGKVHVGAFLSAVDVLALPYRSTAGQGAFPSLVLEALHLGRPLVTTSLPLLEEIAMGHNVALLCPPERPDLLADQLGELLASENLRRSMSQQQIRLARQRFAPERVAPHYEALYASLLNGEDSEGERTQAA
ncbi:MAG: glycosyltransferase family 4 protein [Chloroflexi bacterium]|nr:glycosyltransferase family 4 protein [Chloroflexota bacterium]